MYRREYVYEQATEFYISIRNTELNDSPQEHLEAGKIQDGQSIGCGNLA
jgi:hypothetical protein